MSLASPGGCLLVGMESPGASLIVQCLGYGVRQIGYSSHAYQIKIGGGVVVAADEHYCLFGHVLNLLAAVNGGGDDRREGHSGEHS